MNILLKKYRVNIPAVCAVLFAWFGAAWAEIELKGPGTLDASGEYYRLSEDINAGGTAFTITADNITLDLNEHSVTYNNNTSANSVYGVRISASNVTVKNGTIVQGSGKSTRSPVIFVSRGSGHQLYHLVLKPTGEKCYGIWTDHCFSNSQIHHTYIESHTTTDATRGDGIACIQSEYRGSGGGKIYENILVNGHTGVVIIGNNNRCDVYNNLIQQKRRAGCKAPYGIGLSWKTHNVHVYNNQVISDDGRGIILDGWSQGASEGASGNFISNNRIDVQYSVPASSGYYVENAVYGLRNRYSSGDNTIENNIIVVANDAGGTLRGLYIGSDSSDSLLTNILVQKNTIIAKTGNVPVTYGPIVFYWDYANDITCINNNYYTDGRQQYGDFRVNDLTFVENSVLNTTGSSPGAPAGLMITRFLNSYMLRWDNNPEDDVYEYVVYRDGSKLPISPRGGTFYVDTDIGGTHNYSISALTLAGNEGPRCSEVSTTSAENGWWGVSSGGPSTPPPSGPPPGDPGNLRVL